MFIRIAAPSSYNYIRREIIFEDDSIFNDEPINIVITHDLKSNNIFSMQHIPKIKGRVDGWVGDNFITSAFDKQYIIITDIRQRTINAYIDERYEKLNMKLFNIGSFRTHLARIIIAYGMGVVHGGTVKHVNEDGAILVCGTSGSGKTTFCLDAILSGRYLMCSEDRSVIDLETLEVKGNPVVHVYSNRLENSFLSSCEKIRSGSCDKYSCVLDQALFVNRCRINRVVFVGKGDVSKCERVKDSEKDKKLRQMLFDIYTIKEENEIVHCLTALKTLNVYQVTWSGDDKSFELFEAY